MAELREAFSNSDLPYRVDVVNWPSTTDGFREVIGRKRVLVKVPVADRNSAFNAGNAAA